MSEHRTTSSRVKDDVPVIPVVKRIAQNVRVYGPTFVGQLWWQRRSSVLPIELRRG